MLITNKLNQTHTKLNSVKQPTGALCLNNTVDSLFLIGSGTEEKKMNFLNGNNFNKIK